jgi:hypothetical protein
MWGPFPNSLLMNNLVASQVTDCSRELDGAARCLEVYATLRSRMRNRHDFRWSRAVRLHEIVADWARATSAAVRLKMQTRIRLSLIFSAQLYSVAVWILDIKTVRARLHFQTATL